MNEIMERARQYMDKLAEGLDPISGAAAPEDAALNQERLSKCFRYTAGFLRRELDGHPQSQDEKKVMERAEQYMDMLSHGQNPIGKSDLPNNSVLCQKKLAVCFRYTAMVYRMALEPPLREPMDPVTPALRARIPYSQEPVQIRPFALGVADVLWDQPLVRSFFCPLVPGWLRQKGFTESEQHGVRIMPVPTQRGISAGLSLETVAGEDGSSNVSTLLNEAAQRLIVDHLGQILASGAENCRAILEHLTPEACIRVRLDPSPVSLTEILKQAGSLFPPDLPKVLNAARVNYWLLEKGLLLVDAAGNKCPTEQGRAVGITSPSKRSICWTENAQQYLVDHLREIVLELYAGMCCQPSAVKIDLTAD